MYIFKKAEGQLRFDRSVPEPAQLRKEFLDSLEMSPGDLLYLRRDEWWEKKDVGFSYPRRPDAELLSKLYLSAVASEYKLIGKVLIRRDKFSGSRPISTEEYVALPAGSVEVLDSDGEWKRA